MHIGNQSSMGSECSEMSFHFPNPRIRSTRTGQDAATRISAGERSEKRSTCRSRGRSVHFGVDSDSNCEEVESTRLWHFTVLTLCGVASCCGVAKYGASATVAWSLCCKSCCHCCNGVAGRLCSWLGCTQVFSACRRGF